MKKKKINQTWLAHLDDAEPSIFGNGTNDRGLVCLFN